MQHFAVTYLCHIRKVFPNIRLVTNTCGRDEMHEITKKMVKQQKVFRELNQNVVI